jgi:hypothetical protein
VKFFIIYFVIINFRDLPSIKAKFWAIFGGLVGLSFGIYENILYIKNYQIDFWILLYRIFFVSGLVHMLIGMIYGYLIYKSFYIHRYFPEVFKDRKRRYNTIRDFLNLVKFVYYNSGKSIKVLLDFIIKILTLDVTVDNLILGKKESFYGHSSLEIIIESLVLGVFLHFYYNFSLFLFSMEKMTPFYLGVYLGILIWLLVIVYKILKKQKIYFFIVF